MADWRQPWLQARDRVLEMYGPHSGAPADRLPTPALTVDLDLLAGNIAAMMAALDGQAARLRPHTKVQKSPDIALMQVEAGAIGVTVATIWEAAAMAAAGVRSILVANEIIGPDKITAAAALARHADLVIAVDDARNIADLSAAMVAAGSRADVLVDLDVGMARCGARSAGQALQLARQAHAAPGLSLRGVQAYEGHCMLEPDRDTRIRLATEAMAYAAAVKDQLLADGLPASVLSAGGTGTYNITGRNPAVTELQAGSYVFMDAFHGSLVPGFAVSLTVLTTVLARHGDTVIFDAGRKSVGIDFVLPPIQGYDYQARYYAEEHALFDTDPGFPLRAGDRARLICGYAPTTVNLHDVIFAIRDGQVTDVWPVFPRGPGHSGFLTALSQAD
ncbi:MAG TPA: alanine racemase [Streptosporangiaceae bacterium]|nr:alanine racemase [Streptosporangiaceae bacterium]